MTSVRPVRYLAAREAHGKGLSDKRPPFSRTTPSHPESAHPEVELGKPSGRPDAFESRRRTARFLQLVAAGHTLREAAREAGVKPDRALDLIQDRDEFDRQVAALREAA